MKNILWISLLCFAFMSSTTYGQCDETYDLCLKQLPKGKGDWFTNKQSESLSFEKGQVYETTLMAYKKFEYRLSVCTDIDGGKMAAFKLEKEVVETTTDSTGNQLMKRRRELVFDSSVENEDPYVLFRSSRNEKYFLTVTIPTTGESKVKKLRKENMVCVGVLLQHRTVSNSSF